MIQAQELKKILFRPLSLSEALEKKKEDIRRQISNIYNEVECDFGQRNVYQYNPLYRFSKDSDFGTNDAFREEIVRWLSEHGYNVEWNTSQNAFCVYIKD